MLEPSMAEMSKRPQNPAEARAKRLKKIDTSSRPSTPAPGEDGEVTVTAKSPEPSISNGDPHHGKDGLWTASPALRGERLTLEPTLSSRATGQWARQSELATLPDPSFAPERAMSPPPPMPLTIDSRGPSTRPTSPRATSPPATPAGAHFSPSLKPLPKSPKSPETRSPRSESPELGASLISDIIEALGNADRPYSPAVTGSTPRSISSELESVWSEDTAEFAPSISKRTTKAPSVASSNGAGEEYVPDAPTSAMDEANDELPAGYNFFSSSLKDDGVLIQSSETSSSEDTGSGSSCRRKGKHREPVASREVTVLPASTARGRGLTKQSLNKIVIPARDPQSSTTSTALRVPHSKPASHSRSPPMQGMDDYSPADTSVTGISTPSDISHSPSPRSPRPAPAIASHQLDQFPSPPRIQHHIHFDDNIHDDMTGYPPETVQVPPPENTAETISPQSSLFPHHNDEHDVLQRHHRNDYDLNSPQDSAFPQSTPGTHNAHLPHAHGTSHITNDIPGAPSTASVVSDMDIEAIVNTIIPDDSSTINGLAEVARLPPTRDDADSAGFTIGSPEQTIPLFHPITPELVTAAPVTYADIPPSIEASSDHPESIIESQYTVDSGSGGGSSHEHEAPDLLEHGVDQSHNFKSVAVPQASIATPIEGSGKAANGRTSSTRPTSGKRAPLGDSFSLPPPTTQPTNELSKRTRSFDRSAVPPVEMSFTVYNAQTRPLETSHPLVAFDHPKSALGIEGFDKQMQPSHELTFLNPEISAVGMLSDKQHDVSYSAAETMSVASDPPTDTAASQNALPPNSLRSELSVSAEVLDINDDTRSEVSVASFHPAPPSSPQPSSDELYFTDGLKAVWRLETPISPSDIIQRQLSPSPSTATPALSAGPSPLGIDSMLVTPLAPFPQEEAFVARDKAGPPLPMPKAGSPALDPSDEAPTLPNPAAETPDVHEPLEILIAAGVALEPVLDVVAPVETQLPSPPGTRATVVPTMVTGPQLIDLATPVDIVPIIAVMSEPVDPTPQPPTDVVISEKPANLSTKDKRKAKKGKQKVTKLPLPSTQDIPSLAEPEHETHVVSELPLPEQSPPQQPPSDQLLSHQPSAEPSVEVPAPSEQHVSNVLADSFDPLLSDTPLHTLPPTLTLSTNPEMDTEVITTPVDTPMASAESTSKGKKRGKKEKGKGKSKANIDATPAPPTEDSVVPQEGTEAMEEPNTKLSTGEAPAIPIIPLETWDAQKTTVAPPTVSELFAVAAESPMAEGYAEATTLDEVTPMGLALTESPSRAAPIAFTAAAPTEEQPFLDLSERTKDVAPGTLSSLDALFETALHTPLPVSDPASDIEQAPVDPIPPVLEGTSAAPIVVIDSPPISDEPAPQSIPLSEVHTLNTSPEAEAPNAGDTATAGDSVPVGALVEMAMVSADVETVTAPLPGVDEAPIPIVSPKISKSKAGRRGKKGKGKGKEKEIEAEGDEFLDLAAAHPAADVGINQPAPPEPEHATTAVEVIGAAVVYNPPESVAVIEDTILDPFTPASIISAPREAAGDADSVDHPGSVAGIPQITLEDSGFPVAQFVPDIVVIEPSTPTSTAAFETSSVRFETEQMLTDPDPTEELGGQGATTETLIPVPETSDLLQTQVFPEATVEDEAATLDTELQAPVSFVASDPDPQPAPITEAPVFIVDETAAPSSNLVAEKVEPTSKSAKKRAKKDKKGNKAGGATTSQGTPRTETREPAHVSPIPTAAEERSNIPDPLFSEEPAITQPLPPLADLLLLGAMEQMLESTNLGVPLSFGHEDSSSAIPDIPSQDFVEPPVFYEPVELSDAGVHHDDHSVLDSLAMSELTIPTNLIQDEVEPALDGDISVATQPLELSPTFDQNGTLPTFDEDPFITRAADDGYSHLRRHEPSYGLFGTGTRPASMSTSIAEALADTVDLVRDLRAFGIEIDDTSSGGSNKLPGPAPDGPDVIDTVEPDIDQIVILPTTAPPEVLSEPHAPSSAPAPASDLVDFDLDPTPTQTPQPKAKPYSKSRSKHGSERHTRFEFIPMFSRSANGDHISRPASPASHSVPASISRVMTPPQNSQLTPPTSPPQPNVSYPSPSSRVGLSLRPAPSIISVKPSDRSASASASASANSVVRSSREIVPVRPSQREHSSPIVEIKKAIEVEKVHQGDASSVVSSDFEFDDEDLDNPKSPSWDWGTEHGTAGGKSSRSRASAARSRVGAKTTTGTSYTEDLSDNESVSSRWSWSTNGTLAKRANGYRKAQQQQEETIASPLMTSVAATSPIQDRNGKQIIVDDGPVIKAVPFTRSPTLNKHDLPPRFTSPIRSYHRSVAVSAGLVIENDVDSEYAEDDDSNTPSLPGAWSPLQSPAQSIAGSVDGNKEQKGGSCVIM
ncbi:hypothetical protein DL93DRAFT_1376882 [Clavulina sp. PMI_390]|nr:hypothetical protein DL93DRAFT_1376882 [Clavulina sp. PMI_390]